MTFIDKPILSYIKTENPIQEYIISNYPENVNILQMEFYTEYVSKFSTKNVNIKPCLCNFPHPDLFIQLVAASFSDNYSFIYLRKSRTTEFLFMIKSNDETYNAYALQELSLNLMTTLFINLVARHIHMEIDFKNTRHVKNNKDKLKIKKLVSLRSIKLLLWEYKKLCDYNKHEFQSLMAQI